MSENSKTVVLAEVLKVVSLLPIAGLVLAYCYEFGYFYILGIKFGYILDLQDIALSSAFYVVPALPMTVLGIWSGSSAAQQTSTENKSFASRIFDRGAMILVTGLVVLSASMFLLLGLLPIFGTMATYALLLVILGRNVILPELEPVARDNTKYIWYILVTAMGIAAVGSVHAYHIRSGRTLGYAQFHEDVSAQYGDEVLIFRKFSSGFLVGNETREQLWLVSPDRGSALRFEIDPEPFPGVLCLTLDWCALSGWQPKNNTKPIHSAIN